MTDASRSALPEPPAPILRGSPRPIYDPPLVDQDPSEEREDVEQLEILGTTPLEEELTRDEADRAGQVALDDGRVRELLGGARVTDFGGSLVRAKTDLEPDLIRYQFFSCETLRTVGVVMDRATLDVLEVNQMEGQPAALPNEIDRAVSLAAAELGVDATSGLVGRAIFVTRYNPADPLFGHRLADVRFGRPEERRPQMRALVDVCEERVISAGAFGRARS
jgi:hypothetical protein